MVWYGSRTYSGDWISGTDGLLLGLAVAIAAPVGDLFESLIKRDMGTKDTGTLFGPHGGVLDRVDAALFALVAGYSVWTAVASPRITTANAAAAASPDREAPWASSSRAWRSGASWVTGGRGRGPGGVAREVSKSVFVKGRFCQS